MYGCDFDYNDSNDEMTSLLACVDCFENVCECKEMPQR